MEQIKIVIADDSDKMRNIIQDCVSADEELKVVGTAQNGLEACEMVRMIQPDVLLLDLVMPKLDGITVLERLASDITLEKRPYVIIISAVGSEKIVQETFDKGAAYYMVKPFDRETLISRIKAVVKDQGTRRVRMRKIAPYEDLETVLRREMENEITDIFHKLGIPAHLKGYQYLRDAILMTLLNMSQVFSITKDLYPAIANKYHASISRVERDMRNAIEMGWDRGNMDIIDTLFGYTVQYERGKPTNSEFIALIADKMRIDFF